MQLHTVQQLLQFARGAPGEVPKASRLLFTCWYCTACARPVLPHCLVKADWLALRALSSSWPAQTRRGGKALKKKLKRPRSQFAALAGDTDYPAKMRSCAYRESLHALHVQANYPGAAVCTPLELQERVMVFVPSELH